MPDRKKVILGLNAHAQGFGKRSELCDLFECPYREGEKSCDIEQMCIDALKLLKDQEAVVRCKDCKYCKRTEWNDPWYGSCRYFNTHSIDADGFCYKAERKDAD